MRSTRFARIALVMAVVRVLIPAEPALAAPSCFGKQATQVGTKDHDRIHGTPGTDVIVGLDGNDSINGVNGNDYVCGGPGNDYISGDVGSDRLAGNEGKDRLSGGGDNDVLMGGDENDYLDGNAGSDQLTGDAGDDQMVGQEGNDTLDGKPGNDNMSGGDGADRLSGDEGDDTLRGDLVDNGREPPERWNDDLDGGAGDDTVHFWVHPQAPGGMTVDLERGRATGEGNDRLIQLEKVIVESVHSDVLRGDDDDNTFHASGGADRTFGMGGDDVFWADADDDIHDGGPGSDEISFQHGYGEAVVNLLSGSALGMGSDTLIDIENATGGQGDDILTGDRGPNKLMGLGGQDHLRGGEGDDVLRGGLNDLYRLDRVDTLYGGPGDDIIDGGSPTDIDRSGVFIDGHDEANFSSSTSGVNVDLNAGTATGDGNDKLIRIEDVVGSGSDDVLLGDDGPNEFNASAGNDRVATMQGDDEIEGSPGDDVFDAGSGLDILEFNYAATPVTVDLGAGTATGQGTDVILGVEDLRGTIFDDTLIGDDGPNVINGNVGDDTVSGEGGDDFLHGHRGHDNISGGDGIDELLGMDGNDLMNGGAGDDKFDGSLGNDGHVGGPGNDYMLATLGNDHYQGDEGEDTIDFIFATSAVIVDLPVGTGEGHGVDTIVTIEVVLGTNYDDEIVGDPANNTLLGRLGLDRISGGLGDDIIGGGRGHDAMDGGEGYDMVSYADAHKPVTVDLAQGFAQGSGSDTLVTLEGILGSAFSDYLRGDPGPNRIFGALGDDVMEGREGDDVIDGDGGADVGDGGEGTDQCVEVEYESTCEA